jgi:hypothetical protein
VEETERLQAHAIAELKKLIALQVGVIWIYVPKQICR